MCQAAPFRHLAVLALASLALASGTAAASPALVAAAEANDAPAALAALDAGGDAKAASPDGTTALHWAVHHGALALVERLLAAGADPNARNDYGATPLAEAALIGNAAVIRALLGAGADANARGADEQTPLMIVARSANLDAARALLAHGADVNAREEWRGQTALMWAAAQRQPAMVALLLEHGAEADVRSAANRWPRQVSGEARRMYRPNGGLTALHFAAREGCLECARALVEGGASIDVPDPRNVTPLLIAIDNLHFDTASYLLEAGADPNRFDWWGRSALYLAVDMSTLPHGGRPDRLSVDTTRPVALIERLLAKGANPNLQLKLTPPYRSIVDDRGCDAMLTTGTTPLLRAAKTFDVGAMRLLLAHGAKVDLPNETGITPLMAAAGYGSSECDPRGYGPGIPHYLAIDTEQRALEALDVLLGAGADVNAHTTAAVGRFRATGQTALFGAASWGWNDVVRRLVERGATIDVSDSQGRTPLDAALARAGTRNRGQAGGAHPETAALLESLCAAQAGCGLDRER